MRILFTGFPGGWPGVALLLLRAVLGAALFVQGMFYLRDPAATAASWIVGFASVAAGALITIGLLTPIAGGVVGLMSTAVGLSWLPSATPTLFDAKLPVILAATLLMAIVVLGPGEFSADARLFGRREIIIPRTVNRSPASSPD